MRGVCWEDCECKNLHVPTPPEAANTIAKLLKVDWGNDMGACSLAAEGRLPHPNPQALLGLTSKGKSSQRSGVEAKRQLTDKSNLPKTPVANCSVELDLQPDKTINYSASTLSPASTKPLAPTCSPAEGNQLDMSPRASIQGPVLRDLTPPIPVRPNPAPPLCPAHQAPESLPLPSPWTNRVMVGPEIAEALPYATTVQAPYPPPIDSPNDDLAATAKATAREILEAPYLLSFLTSKQRKTLGGLPEGVKHPAADLLKAYVAEGNPSHTGPTWSLDSLDTATYKGPHASACTPEMTSFIREELRRRIKDGFSILLPEADAMRLLGERLKLSRIAAVPQSYCRPHLILNLSAQPDSDTLSANGSTDREAAPESLQFGRAFPVSYKWYGRRTLSRVWSGCPNWTLQTRTTTAPLNRRRWARLHT